MYQRYEFNHTTSELQVTHNGAVIKAVKIKKNEDGSMSPVKEDSTQISFHLLETTTGEVHGKTPKDAEIINELTEYAAL